MLLEATVDSFNPPFGTIGDGLRERGNGGIDWCVRNVSWPDSHGLDTFQRAAGARAAMFPSLC